MSSPVSSNKKEDTTETAPTSPTDEVQDVQIRKLEDDDESDDESEYQDEGEEDLEDDGEYEEEEQEVDSQDEAANVIHELVELFVQKNGRAPNEEEVRQWIDVFQSLSVGDQGQQQQEAAPVASE